MLQQLKLIGNQSYRTAPFKENRKSKKFFFEKGVLSVHFLCLSVCVCVCVCVCVSVSLRVCVSVSFARMLLFSLFPVLSNF